MATDVAPQPMPLPAETQTLTKAEPIATQPAAPWPFSVSIVIPAYNDGNGAGVKTGVRAATGDVVLILDGDGQHDPADIPRLLAHIGPYDMVIGTRDRAGQQ